MIAVPSVTGVAAVTAVVRVTAVVGVHCVLVSSTVPVVRSLGAVVSAVIVAVLVGCGVPRVPIISWCHVVVRVLAVSGGAGAGRPVVVLVAHGDQPSLGEVDGKKPVVGGWGGCPCPTGGQAAVTYRWGSASNSGPHASQQNQ